MRNLINLLSKVKESYHYVRITSAAKSDIQWWFVGLREFHGKTPFACDVPVPSHSFASDACLVGGAAYYLNDWFYVKWSEDFPDYESSHINVLELKTIIEAAKRWGASWRGQHILVRSDNMSAVSAINISSSRSPELLKLVKELFWLSVRFSFKLSASFLPGKLNVLSDRLSRMHSLPEAEEGKIMLVGEFEILFCKGHMTYAVYALLQEMWRGSWRL